MRLLISFVLPLLTAALPTSTSSSASCAPTSYTLTSFAISTSSSYASVNFGLFANFPDTSSIVEDPVSSGALCYAEGATIPNSNVCDVPQRKLLFDLRGPQEEAYYQITHTWLCDGKTWMSGNAVKIEPLSCETFGQTRTCTNLGVEFPAQNVRQIPGPPA